MKCFRIENEELEDSLTDFLDHGLPITTTTGERFSIWDSSDWINISLLDKEDELIARKSLKKQYIKGVDRPKRVIQAMQNLTKENSTQ